MSDEQHMALPQLFGGPAYSRPPRRLQEIVRPFDPDELPLEAQRIEGEIAAANELAGTTWAPVGAPPVKSKGSRRSRTAKSAKAGQAAVGPVVASPTDNASSGLQGRPFKLRNLGRIFGGDRK